MSNTIKAFVVLGITVLVAACAQQEEEAVVMEEPMVIDEPSMGKM